MVDGFAPFLRSVLAAPDDDVPRLIYADWLDENGQPERAEFIRVQCRLAEIDRRPPLACANARKSASGQQGSCCSCQACRDDESSQATEYALRRRERELLGPAWKAWFGWDLFVHNLLCDNLEGSRSNPSASRIRYSRGFVEEVACTWEGWCRHADAILAATPLRRVRLTTRPEYRFLPNGLAAFYLSGREWAIPRGERLDHSIAGITDMLLGFEFPGVEFERPASLRSEVLDAFGPMNILGGSLT